MSNRILVVDDDASLLNLLRLVLIRAGFEVETAASAKEALERVRERVPDLATIDMMMPEVDGITLCRQLRAMPHTAQMPIIMLTARVDEADRAAALAAGADDYVTKPIPQVELTARIHAALQRRIIYNTLGQTRAITTGWLGVKGGVGTTTVATNVGVLLATEGVSITLMDCQPVPTVDRLLGLNVTKEQHTLAAMTTGGMAPTAVQQLLAFHASGLRVLPGSLHRSKGLRAMPPEWLEMLRHQLGLHTEHLFLDLGTALDAHTNVLLQQCDRVIVVSDADRLSIATLMTLLDELQDIDMAGHNRDVVIVHRSAPSLAVPRLALETRLGKPLLALLPADSEGFARAYQLQQPFVTLHPAGPIAESLRRIGEAITAMSQRAQVQRND